MSNRVINKKDLCVRYVVRELTAKWKYQQDNRLGMERLTLEVSTEVELLLNGTREEEINM